MTQPEALRLADVIANDPCSKAHHDAAAAELRRLHAERTAADGVINDLAAKVRGLQTQRDALLEALKHLHDATWLISRHQDLYDIAVSKARAAIAKAEGQG